MKQRNFEAYLPLRGRWLQCFACGFPVVVWFLFITQHFWSGHPICTMKRPLATTRTQLGNFKTALELYRLDHHGRCPTVGEGLRALIDAPAGSQPGRWHGPYLNDVTEVPLDPWGTPYRYEAPGPHGEPYRIVSLGADELPGGEGEAADLIGTPPLRGSH